MKLNKLALPHPILGSNDDILGTAEIKDVNIEVDSETYNISFNIIHENNTISDLVKSNKATYVCEATCTDTLLRRLYRNNTISFEIRIDRAHVKGKVEFNVYCLASCTIENYSNPASHEDYNGFIFEISKSDPLGYFGKFEFNADIQYQNLKSAASFMVIIPHINDEINTEYIFEGPKIQIKLPKNTYDIFKKDHIGGNKLLAPIIHASLVQNALTLAMIKYKEALSLGGCTWAEAIKYRLENEPDLNSGNSEFDIDQIPLIVQKMLDFPNNRLINCIENLSLINNSET